MKPKKWIPKPYEKFYFVSLSFYDLIVCDKIRSQYNNDDCFLTWNVFKTKREAREAIKKIKQVLSGEL